jgi:propionyl-CoA carboxylase alpha chain
LRDTGIRVDSGVTAGSTVGVHYDPMLAKVVGYAPDRATAARLLAGALARARLHGVATNRDLLVRTLRAPSFVDGDTETAFLEEHPEVFAPLVDTPEARRRGALAAALAGAAARRRDAPVLRHAPSGWRNVDPTPRSVTLHAAPDDIVVRYRFARDGAARHDGPEPVCAVTPERVTLEVDGVRLDYRVHRVGPVSYVDSPEGALTLVEAERFPLPVPALAAGSLTAPLPGTIGRLATKVGAQVAAGDLLLTLEAMKLEHPVLAPTAGVVADLPVTAGDQVELGTVLAVIRALGD